MKAAAAFNHPVTGEKVMPGQSFDEAGLDKEELEDLKKRGYVTDGDGYKAGEKVDLSKLSSTELRAYAGAQGIDTGSLRDRARIEGAINAKQAQANPPAPAEQKKGVLTFGPGTEGASASEETVTAEDQAKSGLENAKARADHEKSIAQSAGAKEKSAEASKQADANLKAAGSKAPPPERKPAAGSAAEKK